jgi:hypothetical protein
MPTNPDPTPPTNGKGPHGHHAHGGGLILNLERLHELIHELRDVLGELDDVIAGGAPHDAGEIEDEDEEALGEAARP